MRTYYTCTYVHLFKNKDPKLVNFKLTCIKPLSLSSLRFQAHCFQFDLMFKSSPSDPLSPGSPLGPTVPIEPISPFGPGVPSLPGPPGTPGTPGIP